jgi:hypothetical protein
VADYELSITAEPEAKVPTDAPVDVRIGNDVRARKRSRSRIWLLLALLAAVALATWYYGYVPIEITDTFGIARHG